MSNTPRCVAAAVLVPAPCRGQVAAVTLRRAGGPVALASDAWASLSLAPGDRVYLPPGCACRVTGEAPFDVHVDRLPAWPLRHPLAVRAGGGVVVRAAGADPMLAIRRAARDLAGYLGACRSLSRSAAYALLGLRGDARLLAAGGARVVAEVSLRGAAT